MFENTKNIDYSSKLIQKLILNQKINKNHNIGDINKMNKDLSLFLLKKSLFLYKNYYNRKNTKKQSSNVAQNLYISQYNTDLFKQLINRLRIKNKLIKDYSQRKYWFYKIKRNFWKVNKKNRDFFFKQFGFKLGKAAKTEFFLKIKNINKIRLFTDIRTYKSTRTESSILGVLLGASNTPNITFYFKKQKRIGYSISRSIYKKILIGIHKGRGMHHTTTYLRGGDSLGYAIPQFYDMRQLVFVNHCGSGKIKLSGLILRTFNIFTIRSYNWKIIT